MKSIFAAAALAITATAVSAQDYPVAAIPSLQLAGSERLAAYAMSRPEMGKKGVLGAMQIYERMGYFGGAGKVTQKYLKFSPVLTWDGNLNGGQANDTFYLWGLPFSIEEDYVAKEGVLVGMSAFGGIRMNLADNLALDVRGNAMLGYSPEHEITKAQGMVDVCARYMVTTETHLHGCIDYSIAEYELGRNERSTLKLGASHAFHNSLGFHEVGAELRHIKYLGDDAYDQNAVVLRWTGALAGGYALNTSVQLGEEVEGRQVVRRKVDLGLTTKVFDRPTTAMFSVQEASGGTFLAQERKETTYSIGLSTQVNKDLGLGIYYSETKANHEFFDSSSVSFSVNYSF